MKVGSNPMTGVLIRGQETKGQTQGEHYVMTEPVD